MTAHQKVPDEMSRSVSLLGHCASSENKRRHPRRRRRPTVSYFGIDVHSKYSEICGVSEEGDVFFRRRIRTTEASLRKEFGGRVVTKVVIETGALSPWVYRVLQDLGLSVSVVNPRRVRLIAESTLKTDMADAEVLARVTRLDLGLLRPVHQRSEAARELRSRLRVRQSLVKVRTSLINSIRGELRSQGFRIRCTSSRRFVHRFGETELPRSVRNLLDPLVRTLAQVTAQIDAIDAELKEFSSSDEVSQRLQTVPGVGPIVSLAYRAWMDTPNRFRRSRDVGACLGLRPILRASGGKEFRGRITREGDREMRRLLVQAAHALLQTKADSALKEWAESLVDRVGKGKALVALSRKIAVLLHHLWVKEIDFEPYPAA